MAASAIYLFNLFLLSCKRLSKTVGLLWRFLNVLTRTSKLFVRTHRDHCDIIHDQVYTFAFHQKLESFQYNASLSVTGTTRGTSREKLNQELSLESLQLRRWYGTESFAAFLRFIIANIQATS